MQMARCFGYRDGYEDLCKIFLPHETLENYQYVEKAVSELRTELINMEMDDKTPEDFGLKILTSQSAIKITAKNKMRSGKEVSIAVNYWVERMDRDQELSFNEHKNDLLQKDLDKFMENALGKKARNTRWI